MLLKQEKFSKVFMTAFEGEENNEDITPDPDATPNPDPKKVEKKEEKNKTFTQEQLDKIVQERLKRAEEKYKESTNELLNKLTELEQRANLTEEERTKLQNRIEELRTENLSAEERAKRELKAQQEKAKSELERITSEAQRWKNDYFNFRLDSELMDAAVANDARAPLQLVTLLKTMSEIKEDIDEKTGQGNGRYVVKIKFKDRKDDGTEFMQEMAPMDAVKRMREMTSEWGNQFSAKSKDGTGLGHDLMSEPAVFDSSQPDFNDIDKYKKWRDSPAGRKALGLPPKN